MKFIIILLLCFFTAANSSCTKKPGETGKTDSTASDKTSPTEKNSTGEKSGNQTAVSDTVFFGEWNGKKIIIEDNYKYTELEKKFTEQEGKGYDGYGDKLKELVKKYGKYNEQTYEYYFTDYKDEFSQFTNLKPGRKIFIAAKNGVYPTQINGYYINFDDMIGSGVIFYATADMPHDISMEERELVVVSYNPNMTKTETSGVTDQALIDKFKGYLMPKLKDVMIYDYDAKGKEISTRLKEINNEEIKIFKGNFTGKDNNEFLVGVNIRNNATNFSSAIWIMDENGKLIREFKPLETNSFTFGVPHMVTDFNGDGVLEVITNDGYYEGGGYNFHKFTGNEFKTLTTGFIFGV